MKKQLRILSILLILCLMAVALVACDLQTEEPEHVHVDYVSQLKLDMTSNTYKIENPTIKNHVDGDTVHFNVSRDIVQTGVLKARFLAINTPESTGKIEAYGYKASRFTKEALKNAESIIIESDDSKLNVDSTGDRYLVWIWYKPAGATEYRNLNVEILQNGLAIASNTSENRYGETAMKALEQARAEKLNVHSGEKDPEMYYGNAIPLTMKELCLNVEDYENKKVAFEGVIVRDHNSSVYIEEFDEETGLYFGMTVYYGHLSGRGLRILGVGNRVRIVGTLQYYETGGKWQVTGLSYDGRNPDDPDNIKLISEGNAAANTLVDPDLFAEGKVSIEFETEEGVETVEYDYTQITLYTSISMNNLEIVDIYTTNNGGSSDGAMTFTCQTANGKTIDVRTEVLTDENGDLVTADRYEGKTINVVGIVDIFSGEYQIRVFAVEDITIVE